jgi:type IV secretory pathway VirB10-like protein
MRLSKAKVKRHSSKRTIRCVLIVGIYKFWIFAGGLYKNRGTLMSDIEKLLAQVKAEYEQAEPPAEPIATPSPRPEPQPPSDLDRLLVEVKAEVESPIAPTPSPGTGDVPVRSHTTNSSSFPIENSYLQELQAEYQQKERAQAERQQQKQREQEKLQEQRQQRQQQALKQKAQEWLKKLDPKSEEGKWFEEFAYSHTSRLEAAMDYLAALRETGL